jgi:hypothetical protein
VEEEKMWLLVEKNWGRQQLFSSWKFKFDMPNDGVQTRGWLPAASGRPRGERLAARSHASARTRRNLARPAAASALPRLGNGATLGGRISVDSAIGSRNAAAAAAGWHPGSCCNHTAAAAMSGNGTITPATVQLLHDQALLAAREGRVADAAKLHEEAKRAFADMAAVVAAEDPETSKSFLLLSEFHRQSRRALRKSGGDLAFAAVLGDSSPRHDFLPALARPSASPPATMSPAQVLARMAEDLERPAMATPVGAGAFPDPPGASSQLGVDPSPRRLVRTQSPPAKFGEESYYFVPGDDMGASIRAAGSAPPDVSAAAPGARPGRVPIPTDPARLYILVRSLTAENEKLARERDEARRMFREEQAKVVQQGQRFWSLFVALKAALEQAPSPARAPSRDKAS